jgi:drug/metabolite transporter (DMT)-like permease
MPAEYLATMLILSSALLHAAANALIKISDDPLLIRGFMSAVSALLTLPFIVLVAPPTPAAWPVLAASVLVHGLYPFFVAAAYRRGDLSVVFPIARGISPLGVLALVAVLDGAGLTGPQLAGVTVISAGILALVVGSPTAHGPAIGFAFVTGVVVAIYTFLDGMGLRQAETTLSYIVWLIVLDGAFTTSLIVIARHATLAPFLRRHWKHALVAAVLGLLNFGMALYALGLGPLVEIAALRETSVVFAAFLGTRFLGEGFATRRIVAALAVMGGITIMQLLR